MILNFLILAHQQPSQLERLVRLLDFPQARFFIHVDKKTDLKRFRQAVGHISTPVTFIRKRHNISWGGMEMVAATLDLIEAALTPGEKGYSILLSGQDLPLKPVTAFYGYLEAHYGEEFLSFRRLPYSNWNMNGGLDRIEYYWFMDQLPPEENMRLYEAQKSAGMRRIFPFDINLFGGSQWWCLTNEAATYICDFLNVNPEYTDYFKHTFIPDESFFQTILLNAPFSGRVTGNNLRFMDWSGPEMPKVLTMDDYDQMMGSGCFFARKFEEERDIAVVRRIEKELVSGKFSVILPSMPQTRLYNWLIMAFSEPLSSLTEAFYYDKRDKEFYSIHFADFMLVNDDLSLNEAASSSYPDGIAVLIADRIAREEKGDRSIIWVPRVEVETRKAIMEEFIRSVDDEKLLKILEQRVKNQDGSQRFDFYFGEEATNEVRTRWELLKRERLISIIHEFIDGHEIDFEASQVWDIGDSFYVDLDLR